MSQEDALCTCTSRFTSASACMTPQEEVLRRTKLPSHLPNGVTDSGIWFEAEQVDMQTMVEASSNLSSAVASNLVEPALNLYNSDMVPG